MKKLLFLIIIIALGLGYWFMSQKSTISPSGVDTSDWQTFKNEKYGYEVKYPTLANIEEIAGGKATDIVLTNYLGAPFPTKNSDGIDFILRIETEEADNPKNLILTDWLEENIFSGYRSVTPAGGREMTLAGEPAYYIEQNHNGKGGLYAYTRYTIYMLHNGNLYQISGVKLPQSPSSEWLAHPYYQYLEKSIPISEAILNSFRFTK